MADLAIGLQAAWLAGTIFVPPCAVLVCWLGWRWARYYRRPEVARRWAITGVVFVGMTALSWLTFRFPIPD